MERVKPVDEGIKVRGNVLEENFLTLDFVVGHLPIIERFLSADLLHIVQQRIKLLT